jgi:hypothetical protein
MPGNLAGNLAASRGLQFDLSQAESYSRSKGMTNVRMPSGKSQR